MLATKPRSKFSLSRKPIVIRNTVRGVGDAYEVSQGCIAYEDPNNPGVFVSDVNTQSQCAIPGDPGESQAVASDVQSFIAQQNLQILNAKTQQAQQEQLAQSGNPLLPSNSLASSSSGLGLGVLPSPLDPSTAWLIFAGLGVAFVMFAGKK